MVEEVEEVERVETNNAKAIQGRSRTAAPLLAAWLLSVSVWLPTGAEASQAGEASKDFGMGVVTVLSNVVYMPVKVCYALLGGITGSLAWGLTGGNRDVADQIWVPSMGGDYVLTTDMMSGEDPVHFSGLRREPASESRGGGRMSDQTASPSDESSGGDEEPRGSSGGSAF